jgi:IPT/TIG domain
MFGHNFTAEGDDLTPQISVAPAGGVTLQVSYVSDGQINMSYSVASNASPGAYGVQVTTYAGSSSVSNIMVGDPTPVITSVIPNTWSAGAVTPFTITGTGFGTNPTLTVVGTGITISSITGIPTDTQIRASVTIVPYAITGPAVVTVQSNGYNGLPFQPKQPGQPKQASAAAGIVATAVPHVSFTTPSGGSQDVTNNATPVSVTVGQQIALTVTWSGVVIPQTESWVVNDALGNSLTSVVGNYNGFAQQGQLTMIQIPATTSCQATAPCFTFYFVWAGSSGEQTQTVVYNYTLTGGQNGSVRARFDVNGPILNSNSVAVTYGAAHVSPDWGLEFGDLTQGGTPGATFTAPNPIALGPHAAPGQNALYNYVQLVTGDTRTELPSNDPTHTTSNPQICNTTTLGLDNVYPLPFGPPGQPPLNIFVDSPTTGLPTTLGERLRDFSATLYLMWDPGLSVGKSCVPSRTTAQAGPPPTFTQFASNCASIPVPLVSIAWEFKACFINTLNPAGGTNLDGSQNGTPWSVSCGQPKPPQITVLQPGPGNNYAYPRWTSTFTNVGGYTCH